MDGLPESFSKPPEAHRPGGEIGDHRPKTGTIMVIVRATGHGGPAESERGNSEGRGGLSQKNQAAVRQVDF